MTAGNSRLPASGLTYTVLGDCTCNHPHTHTHTCQWHQDYLAGDIYEEASNCHSWTTVPQDSMIATAGALLH